MTKKKRSQRNTSIKAAEPLGRGKEVGQTAEANIHLQYSPGSLLCDTGVLLALADLNQAQHQTCQHFFKQRLRVWPAAQLISSWSCFTEASYLAHRQGGWPLQQKLAELIQIEILRLYTPFFQKADYDRLFALMEQYQNVPMDLADATLVLMAEATGLREILTLDSDFQIYRVHQHEAFEILP